MTLKDEEKIVFIIKKGLYHYKIIYFGLKNVGATYYHFINKIFKHQIDSNMEVYIDDMLVKSSEIVWHMANLKEAFDELRQY